MKPPAAKIAPEVIACIAEGRSPTLDELYRVVHRIEAEVQGAGPAFAWGAPGGDGSARLLSLRAAHAALTGGGDVAAPECRRRFET